MTKDELIKKLQDSDMAGDDPVFAEVYGTLASIEGVDDGQNAIIIYLK